MALPIVIKLKRHPHKFLFHDSFYLRAKWHTAIRSSFPRYIHSEICLFENRVRRNEKYSFLFFLNYRHAAFRKESDNLWPTHAKQKTRSGPLNPRTDSAFQYLTAARSTLKNPYNVDAHSVALKQADAKSRWRKYTYEECPKDKRTREAYAHILVLLSHLRVRFADLPIQRVAFF